MTDFSSSISASTGWRSAEAIRQSDDASTRPARIPLEGSEPAPGRTADSVELSDRARLIASLRPASAARSADQTFRPELVDRIRREIETGTYDSPTKEAIAADRLARDLNGTVDRQA